MQVYSPEVEGYSPIDSRIDEAAGVAIYDGEHPGSKSLHLPAIDESVPVYEGSFRLVRGVMIGQGRELGDLVQGGKLATRGSLRSQACDDKMCYLPTSVPLEWTVDFEQHDRQRASEDLRR